MISLNAVALVGGYGFDHDKVEQLVMEQWFIANADSEVTAEKNQKNVLNTKINKNHTGNASWIWGRWIYR